MQLTPPPPPSPRMPVRVAILGSAALVALTVAAKSARDALFCAQFSVADLPKVMIAGAGLSALFAVGAGRALRYKAPAGLLPPLLVANAGAFVAEHAWIGAAPHVVALVLYLHVSAVTGLIISGFWSVVNERFDPHALRLNVSRIGLGGTLGGLFGGLTAERIASLVGARHTLIALSVLSLVGAVAVAWLRPRDVEASGASQLPPPPTDRRSNYVRELACFVLLTALASSVLDFAFKSRAIQRFSNADELTQFFALFYTATSAASFLVQAFVTAPVLERMGLGVGLAALPVAVASTGLLSLGAPGIVSQTLLRGVDGTLSTTIFRSAYEPLYTPLPAERKRSVKALIDVLVNRIGDASGSLLAWVLVWWLPSIASNAATGAAVVAASGASLLAVRLRRGYVAELAESLRSGAVGVNDATALDLDTKLTLSRTIGALEGERLRAEIKRRLAEDARLKAERAETAKEHPAAAERGSELLLVLGDLTSHDSARLRRGLERAEPILTSFIIPLLGREDAGALAMKTLSSFGSRIVGQLADALRDRQHLSTSVRRRVVRVIAALESPAASAALLVALDDPDFDVRQQVGRSLDALQARGSKIALEREVAVALAMRELDAPDTISTSERLEQALRVLGFAFEPEAFKLVHRAVTEGDPQLRGTGLEYLENVLPDAIRVRLFAVLESGHSPRAARVEGEILAELRRTLG